MRLLQVYKCLCEETRLRLLHLLTHGPLCVCHFQAALDLPQVAISKHLGCLRDHGFVTATRHGRWMIYALPDPLPAELAPQLRCLQDVVATEPVFRSDLRRLRAQACDCAWVQDVVPHRRPVRRSR